MLCPEEPPAFALLLLGDDLRSSTGPFSPALSSRNRTSSPKSFSHSHDVKGKKKSEINFKNVFILSSASKMRRVSHIKGSMQCFTLTKSLKLGYITRTAPLDSGLTYTQCSMHRECWLPSDHAALESSLPPGDAPYWHLYSIVCALLCPSRILLESSPRSIIAASPATRPAGPTAQPHGCSMPGVLCTPTPHCN